MEPDKDKQAEKRGRFIIQEIEDDTKTTSHKQAHHQSSHSKRPKHSSIIMDSKIFHTTRVDSELSNVSFTTLVYEEGANSWVEFAQIWKDFSKSHVGVDEDNMEKIFSYIDVRMDDSDILFYPSTKVKETGISQKNKTDNGNNDFSCINQASTSGLVLTNIRDMVKIISPPISPIRDFKVDYDFKILDLKGKKQSKENLLIEKVTNFSIMGVTKHFLVDTCNIDLQVIANPKKEEESICNVCKSKINFK